MRPRGKARPIVVFRNRIAHAQIEVADEMDGTVGNTGWNLPRGIQHWRGTDGDHTIADSKWLLSVSAVF